MALPPPFKENTSAPGNGAWGGVSANTAPAVASSPSSGAARPQSPPASSKAAPPAGSPPGPEWPDPAFPTDPLEEYDGLDAAPAMSSAKRKRAEKVRRRRELMIAALAFLVVLILTTIQLNQFRTGDRFFVIMFNVNFVLLIGIFVVVIRNGIKLLLERRRKVLGSRLRTRLVLAFVAIALMPCLLMFFVTTKYVQLSMDFWFKEQIETSMEVALDIGRSVYENMGKELVSTGFAVKQEMAERGLSYRHKAMAKMLESARAKQSLAVAALVKSPGDRIFWGHAEEAAEIAFETAWEKVSWELVEKQGFETLLVQGFDADYLFCVSPLGDAPDLFFVFAKNMGAGFKAKLDRIVMGAGEYRELRRNKKPLKILLYSSLGVMTALILLSAIWFAFRLAREISAPVLAVAAGSARIARGDLSVRLDDTPADELGVLIRAFNEMAKDLEKTRVAITGANTMLEEQNSKIERHSTYIETVLNNIAAGVISFDAEGRIITLNMAASEILCMKAEYLIGKRVDQILPPPHGEVARALHRKFRERGEARSKHTVSLPLGGEERRLLVNVVSFANGGVYSGAVAVFEDITDLERMQRVAAWREVARRIAHEIKNPLTPIKLSAERLARKFGKDVPDPVFIQSTSLIVRQVEHLQSMVQEFSAFAKLPEVTPKPDRMEPLLQSLTDLFRNSHAHIHWELEIEEELPLLPIDREALNRAFMNLFSNAAEALAAHKGNSAPSVRTTAVFLPDMRLVRVDVADNGPGLTEEERARVFEPYFSRKKGGTGLGLTIVRSIVTDHRGYVRALPGEGGGTVMSMELPLG